MVSEGDKVRNATMPTYLDKMQRRLTNIRSAIRAFGAQPREIGNKELRSDIRVTQRKKLGIVDTTERTE